MNEPTVGRTGELAQLLADGDPAVWTTLRAVHLAGPDGRCPACRSSNGAAPFWPCTLRTIAEEAAQLVRARRRA